MNSSRKQAVVIDGSFGGLNAAYELRWQLGQTADITLISKDSEFTRSFSVPIRCTLWCDTPTASAMLRVLHFFLPLGG
jgi:hypothetical protein